MNNLDEKILVQDICRHLDASIARLPQPIQQSLDESRQVALLQNTHSTLTPDIEARLDQIRHRAVAKFEQQQGKTMQSNRFSLSNWVTGQLDAFNFPLSRGMLATACVMITAISIFYVNSRPAGTLTLEEELGLIATAEDIELYENLDFYLWLAENESLTL